MVQRATLYRQDPDFEGERRDSTRHRIDGASTMRGADGAPIDVIVNDLSRGGFQCVGDAALVVGAGVSLGLDGIGRSDAVVRWIKGRVAGCEFAAPLTDAQVLGAFRAGIVIRGQFAARGDLPAAGRSRTRHGGERMLGPVVGLLGVVLLAIVAWYWLQNSDMAGLTQAADWRHAPSNH